MLASGRSHLRTATTKSLSDLSVRNGQLKILHLSTFSLQSVCPLFLLFLHSSFQVSLCPSAFSFLSYTFYLFLSLLSLSFPSLSFYLIFSPPTLLYFFFFYTCTHPDKIFLLNQQSKRSYILEQNLGYKMSKLLTPPSLHKILL